MSLIVALILGLVQGVAEFLPISSSGHLTLISKLFGVENNILLTSVLLHFATLFVVAFTFRKYIWELIKHPFSKESVKFYIATVPTVLIVIFFKIILNNYFENSKILPFGFLLTGMLLLFTYLINERKNEYKNNQINKKSAFIMGIAQGFAVLPGISRSGSTICAGLLSGEKREETARFSFVMSIPIILASVIYELITEDISTIAISSMIAPILISLLTAFIVGLFSVKMMLKIVKNAKYYWFSIYLFIISIASFFIV